MGWQRQPSPSLTSHFLRPSKEAPTRQKHNLQSNLVSHICPFTFLISTPLTYLDTFKAESQADHPSMRSFPITVRRGLSMVLVLFFPPRRAGVGRGVGLGRDAQVRERSPSLVLGSSLSQTPARALGELLLCTHMQGHVLFQHNPPISHSTQKPVACKNKIK